MPGLSESGFETKSFGEIKSSLESRFKEVFKDSSGDNINLESTSLLGGMVGILTKEFYSIWELMADTYQSRYAHTATGKALEGIVELGNLTRQIGSRTSGVLYISGQVNTVIPQRTSFSTKTGFTVETQETVTLVQGQKPVLEIARQSGNLSATWTLVVTGSFFNLFPNLVDQSVQIAFTDTPSQVKTKLETVFGAGKIESVLIQQGTATITFSDYNFLPELIVLGADSRVVTIGLPDGASVGCEALGTGKFVVAAGEVTEIDTPLTGLERVLNLLDLIPGRDDETDRELRERWYRRALSSETSSVGAIRSKILNLQGVSQCEIAQKQGAIDSIVNGGDPSEIANVIFKNKAGGIITEGNQLEFVEDDRGVPNPIYFSRPDIRSILIRVTYSADETFESTGQEQMTELLVEYAQNLPVGSVIRPTPDMVWALNGIIGLSFLSIEIGESQSLLSTTPIQLAPREVMSVSQVLFRGA